MPLNGLHRRETVRTDGWGIWRTYLENDKYLDTLFINQNGVTYALIEHEERLSDSEGIFDQYFRGRALANATSRQVHRKFVSWT